jgi:predicted nucleic acid-binding Zn finger protein
MTHTLTNRIPRKRQADPTAGQSVAKGYEPFIKPGLIVFSKRGRDKGLPFIVIGMEDGYVYLVDGLVRKLDKPKKKKIKHIQVTGTAVNIHDFNQRGLQDADVRKFLREVSNIGERRCY